MTATRSYNPLHEPTDKQRIAIDTLITGGTHAEAAEAAGVHRVTVSKWATKVPGFNAELNRRRAELLSGTSDRIRALDSQALAIVAAQVEEGDPELAMQWLRLRRVGAVSVDAVGPTDPVRVVEAEVEWRRRAQESADTDLLMETAYPNTPSRDHLREEVLREAENADVEE